MFQSASQALAYLAQNNVAMVDLKIPGLFGQLLHITVPARQFSEHHLEDGVGYDGSSGAGFGAVESADVVALPDLTTAFRDPFCAHPTLSFLCQTVTADTRAPIPGDPRGIARRAVEFLKSTHLADEAWMAPEFEFTVFDRLELRNDPYDTRAVLHGAEGALDDNGQPPLRPHSGYLRTPPAERLHDLRSEICLELEQIGIPVRYHHHEVGAAGQCEIEVGLQPLVRAADQALLIKYFIKNVARRRGKLATFMPKPVFGEAGNGMHVHQRLTHGREFVFFDQRERNYAGLSDLALQYTLGLLAHGRALTGLTNPSTNSFKRLIDGYEAPVNLFYSLANRSAAVRVPRYATSPAEKRIEYRPPDFTGNVYLTLAAMLMAGLAGVRDKLDPATNAFGPFDVDIARQDAAFREKILPLPRSLEAALDALAADHAFLLAGDVFPAALIDGWIAAKRAEAQRISLYPHPQEYALFVDA